MSQTSKEAKRMRVYDRLADGKQEPLRITDLIFLYLHTVISPRSQPAIDSTSLVRSKETRQNLRKIKARKYWNAVHFLKSVPARIEPIVIIMYDPPPLDRTIPPPPR